MGLFAADADRARLVEAIDMRLSLATWVLGCRVIPQRPESFVVLTTTHIMVYRVTQKGLGDARAELLSRWRHFKSPEDLTLRLDMRFEHEGESSIFPHSICETFVADKAQIEKFKHMLSQQ